MTQWLVSRRDLGHDAAHRLDEVEVRLVEGELRVVLEQRARERAELGEDLDAGEAAADDDEGEQALALGTGREVRRLVEVREHAVADRDGLFDRLEADRVVGDAGDREGARDGAARDHDDVVVELPRLTDLGRDRGGLRRVVDARDLRGDDVGLLQVPALRDHRVTRLDRACGHLGKERLVRHVGKRVDDGDLGLAGAQPLLELPRRVEPRIATADDENLGHGEWTPQFWYVRPGARDHCSRVRTVRLVCRVAPMPNSAASVPNPATSESGTVIYASVHASAGASARRPIAAAAGRRSARSSWPRRRSRSRGIRSPVHA